MTDDDKAYLGWPQFGDAMWLMAKTMKEHDEDFDSVVGIARGGVPGAVYLCHAFDARLCVVPASHYDGEQMEEDVDVGTFSRAPEKDTLIFDDIVETGDTMSAVYSLVDGITRPSAEVTTASINVKPEREFEPQYWVEQTEDWVVYPWEADL